MRLSAERAQQRSFCSSDRILGRCFGRFFATFWPLRLSQKARAQAPAALLRSLRGLPGLVLQDAWVAGLLASTFSLKGGDWLDCARCESRACMTGGDRHGLAGFCFVSPAAFAGSLRLAGAQGSLCTRAVFFLSDSQRGARYLESASEKGPLTSANSRHRPKLSPLRDGQVVAREGPPPDTHWRCAHGL